MNQIVAYCDSIISQANDLRTAAEAGTLSFPDGEENGIDEILSHLDVSDDALDTITSYYL